MMKSSLAILGLVLGIFSFIDSVSALARLPSEATLKQVADYLDKYATSNHIPCFSTAFHLYVTESNGTVVKDQLRWVHQNPDGLADIENSVKCTTDSMLRVSSISKPITVAVVASLVDRGDVHWDDDIRKYIPESVFPTKVVNGEKVSFTLRMLAAHLTGIRQSDEQDFLKHWYVDIHNSTQVLQMFANEPLLFKPGTKYHYTNFGTAFLAAIVEAVEQRSYHLVVNDFMRKTILAKTAQSDDLTELIPHRAQQYEVITDSAGHYLKTKRAPILDNLRPFPHWPAGIVLSSANDIVQFGDQMLRSYRNWAGHPFRQSIVQELWNYKPPVGGGKRSVTVAGVKYADVSGHYAMGWERFDFPAESKDGSLSHLEVVEHGGSMPGANTILVVLPGQNFVFSALSNRGNAGDLSGVALQVYHILANGK